ncbi:MAG: aspartate-semialdehyde dehydrogenase [Alphaproteobacteria bacterium]
MGYNIAVVGATGKVGREMLSILDERNFPFKEVIALASKASVGKEVSFGEKNILKIQDLENFDFSNTDIALFSAGSAVSKIHAKRAALQGCIVIDNSSCFRMEKDIPLIIPEVNPEDLKLYKKTNIIANPNCSLIQLLVALKPLEDISEIKRIVLSTYQSTSGAGKTAMDELYNQTKNIYLYQECQPNKFPKQIAFNILPQIGSFLEDGSTEEEQKIVNEAKKIMGINIQVSATCVRVPVFIGHSISANIEFYDKITIKEVKKALKNANGVELIDRLTDGGYITPIECVKEDAVYVSRVREDFSQPNSISMWIVSDNLRKGAALNAIQIAEELIKTYIK